MLPAAILGFLGRAVVGEAAATATGARVASSLAPGNVGMAKEAGEAAKKAQQVSNAFGQMNRGMQTAENIVTHWSTHLVGTLNMANSAIAGMAAPVAAIVALANPAKVAAYEVAAKDASAVVGRELIPVLDAFTRTTRKVGDVVASFEPVVQPAITAIAHFVDDFGDKFVQEIINAEPAIQSLTSAIVAMTAAAESATVGVGKNNDFKRGVWAGAAGGMAAVGQDGPKRDPTRTSRFAASQEARFVGAKSISDEAIKSAMMQGITGKSKEEEQLEKMNEQQRAFFGWIMGKDGNGGAGDFSGNTGSGGDFDDDDNKNARRNMTGGR